MHILNAAVLGLIQGLTEFLPVSSSGHLVIFREIFGFSAGENALLLDLLLHFGTLVAVFIVFFKDVTEIIKEFFLALKDLLNGKFSFKNLSPYRRFLIMIIVSLLPLFLILPAKNYIVSAFENLWIVGSMLLITGTFLIISDLLPRGKKGMSSTGVKDALVIGAVQAIAVMPGISRSGSTITAGLFRGFSREHAVKFSFIMSLPAILGANILEIKDLNAANIENLPFAAYLTGIAVAIITGIAAIKLIQIIVKSNKFRYFGFYCIFAGVSVMVYNIFNILRV